jgi:hypothetical protein
MVVSTVTRFPLIVWLVVECLQMNRRYFVGLIADNFIPRSKLRRLIYKWQRLASRNSRTSLQNINYTIKIFFVWQQHVRKFFTPVVLRLVVRKAKSGSRNYMLYIYGGSERPR